MHQGKVFRFRRGLFREAEWHLRYRGKASRRRDGLPRIAERFPGTSERFPGNAEKFPGNEERLPGNEERLPGNEERLFNIRKRLPEIGEGSFAIKGRGQWDGRLGMVIPPVGAGHAL